MSAAPRALPSAVSDALGRFQSALRKRYGHRMTEIVLFGSQVRGEAHEESDVDVLVVIEDLSEHDRVEVLDLAAAVDGASPEWVGLAPLVYSSEQAVRMRNGGRRLFQDIDREGIRL